MLNDLLSTATTHKATLNLLANKSPCASINLDSLALILSLFKCHAASPFLVFHLLFLTNFPNYLFHLYMPLSLVFISSKSPGRMHLYQDQWWLLTNNRCVFWQCVWESAGHFIICLPAALDVYTKYTKWAVTAHPILIFLLFGVLKQLLRLLWMTKTDQAPSILHTPPPPPIYLGFPFELFLFL